MRAFLAALKEAGFVDGQNLNIEYRWAEGRFDRLPTFATELAQHPVDVIMAALGTVSALAAKRATSTSAFGAGRVRTPNRFLKVVRPFACRLLRNELSQLREARAFFWNYILYISTLYEFSHSLGANRKTFARSELYRF